MKAVLKASVQLSERLEAIDFTPCADFVYNPLEYASKMHGAYIKQYAQATCEVLFLGMNPGPFGMAQTGVPFGEVSKVRDWMQLNEPVGKPEKEHPKRPVLGLECHRSEVSGKRLWGLFEQRFPDPRDFFKFHFVVNYCPLLFLESSGRNKTPDKMPKHLTEELFHACDTHLIQLIDALSPTWLVGVGQFAEQRLQKLNIQGPKITRVLHPSPASPAANKGWAEQATQSLIADAIWSK